MLYLPRDTTPSAVFSVQHEYVGLTGLLFGMGGSQLIIIALALPSIHCYLLAHLLLNCVKKGKKPSPKDYTPLDLTKISVCKNLGKNISPIILCGWQSHWLL